MDRILFVEGEEDSKFFKAYFKALDWPSTPEIKHHPSGKQNTITSFIAKLQLLTRASKAQVGLVVDADQTIVQPTNGFSATQKDINGKLSEIQFDALTIAKGTSGLVCRKPGSPNVLAGLWVMPNNSDDGYLEHLIASATANHQATQLAFSQRVTGSIVGIATHTPPFACKVHHKTKAELGAWLAWSDPPRMSFGAALSRGLIDHRHQALDALNRWLAVLFPAGDSP